MAFQLIRRICAILSLTIASCLPSLASAQQSEDPKTARIELIIRNYLLANPELLVEVVQKLEERQRAKEKSDLIGAIKSNRKALFASTTDFIVNPLGRVPVVEFFDYQCGYCKKFLPSVTRLLKADKTVRFVFKEFPILGPVSVTASRAALAAKMQGKYLAFHNAVLGLRRRLSEALIYQIAGDVGLDVARLKTDMKKPEITAIIDGNRKLAAAMGIRGTPSIVIGEQMAPGAISYEQLTAMVDQARKNCSVC
ncbi:MAG: DsbA family protein [Alphaproteobacteria bacterium]